MNSDVKKLIICILLCMEYIVGCASPVTTPIRYNSGNKHKYDPITLNINSGKYRGALESELADYIYESFRKTGLFLRVDRPPKNNSIVLNINYTLDQPMNPGVFVGTMLSAVSLLLLPVDNDESHSMDVEIFNSGQKIMTATYTEQATTTLSFFHDSLEGRKDGINKLLKQLLEDIANNGILPRTLEPTD